MISVPVAPVLLLRYCFLGLFSVLFLFGCAQPKPLVYRDVKQFRVKEINLENLSLELGLGCYNPNRFGFSLKDGNVDAFIDNKFVGKALLPGFQQIPALDSFIIPLVLQTPLKNLVSNAFSLLAANNKEVRIKLKGVIRVGKGSLLVPIPVNYEGLQRINL